MDEYMMFCYDAATMPMHDSHEYWNESEVAEIAIYEVTPRIERVMRKEGNTLLPICGKDLYSWEFADCRDETEAFDLLMWYLNQSVYEFLNDL